jgi:pyruvate dehydrogenase E2 component (dihydrolipoamide acetyltransferase)
MPIEITMPKLSDTMAEGTILKWRVGQGDRVRRGEIIAEVETDKAAMEMEAFEEGTVAELRVEEGEAVPVGTVIAVLAAAGEPVAVAAPAAPVKAAAPPAAAPPAPAASSLPPAAEAAGPAASPAARKLARERGVELSRLRGTGPGGRIVLADVERVAPAVREAAERPAKKSVRIRRLVARKMVESWQAVPHFFVTVAVDMTDVIRFRKDLSVTINDFVLAAAARALGEHPWVNSHCLDGEPVEQESIDIAMAVATERGLYNPVIRGCGELTLKEISRRAAELADKAHRGKLAPEDLEGGTFTISNMGMLGVESFSAIITPPQAAVLAVGTVKGEVVVDEHGEPAIAPILRLTLSADHRILDGADAAEFLATLKSYLEAPVTLVSCHYGKEK